MQTDFAADGESQFNWQEHGVIELEKILQYLKDHGERLDSEIAAETGVSLESVCLHLSELAAKGEVIMCRTTRFIDGKTTEGMLCRVSGFVPQASPGRKSKGHS